jgi:hypothetical protein
MHSEVSGKNPLVLQLHLRCLENAEEGAARTRSVHLLRQQRVPENV